MMTFNIFLPDSLGQFIEEQVRNTGHSNASEYIQYLIRKDQERVKQQYLEALLIAGLDSGEPVEVTDEWWEQKRTKMNFYS